MLKYLAKISMDIFPSVLATIIGAYIVNHYINARPATDTPAAVVAPSQAGSDGKPADTASHPAPGVKAKGVSEKSLTEKAAVEKPSDKSETKAADLPAAETASHGRPTAREKAAAKSNSAVTAPVAEANSAPAAATPDANDLARAAIERLRKSPEGKAGEKAAEAKAAEAKAAEARAAEAKAAETRPAERTPEPVVREAVRIPEAPRVITTEPSALRPLPPPITVSTPSFETYGNGGSSPSYTASVGNDDPNRITPPADIPVPVIPPPLDLRADAGASMPRPKKTNVADDVLSGMKSMFHSVLPRSATPD
jgi:hypothetical protein